MLFCNMYGMKNKLFFIAVWLFAFCSQVHVYGQEKSGILEIFFPKSIAGSVAIREWANDAETGRSKVITIDSAKIVNGKYMYQYHKKAPTQVYLDVYPKDSLGFNRIFSFNPYFKNYLDCVVLDNEHAVIKTDSIFFKGYRGWQLRATIEGSSETDMLFKLLCDAFNPTMQYQFTDPNQGHVTDFDFIKKNPKSQFLLNKIYDDRTCYSTTDSIAIAFSFFDTSTQDSEVGRKLSSYIRKQSQFSERGIADTFIYYDKIDQKYTFEQFLDGKQLGLIVFWASWCGPCIKKIPELRDLYEKFKGNVSFVSLSVDESKKEWVKAVDTHTVDWLNLAGFPESNKKVADAFDIGLVPSYLVVDATGKVLLNALNGYGEIDGQNEYINVDKLNDYLSKLIHKQ